MNTELRIIAFNRIVLNCLYPIWNKIFFKYPSILYIGVAAPWKGFGFCSKTLPHPNTPHS